MGNTIWACLILSASCRKQGVVFCAKRFFLVGRTSRMEISFPTLLPENGSLCCYPLKFAQGPGPNNPEVNVPDSFGKPLWGRRKVEVLQSGEAPYTAGGMASVCTVLTCTYTYQVRIELQFISKQLLLECKERAHAGNVILVLDRYTLWSLIGLSSGWHRIKRRIWRLASRFDLYQLLWHCFISCATSLCPPWRMPRLSSM